MLLCSSSIDCCSSLLRHFPLEPDVGECDKRRREGEPRGGVDGVDHGRGCEDDVIADRSSSHVSVLIPVDLECVEQHGLVGCAGLGDARGARHERQVQPDERFALERVV